MDENRLQEIEARAEAATPGPWNIDNQFRVLKIWDKDYCDYVCDNWDGDNAKFISHARQDIPDLLKEIERLDSLAMALGESRSILIDNQSVLEAEIEQFAIVVENETGLLNDDELTPERLAEFLRCLNHQAEHASELIREKDAVIERLRAQGNETCKWTLGDDEYGFWETRCGGAVVFEEETPQANGYKYCHYCGKLIEFTALKGGE